MSEPENVQPGSPEIDPFLLFRPSDGEAEVALWRLADGARAVALFVDEAAAVAYRQAAELDAEWQVLQPEKPTLRELLAAAVRGGILFAVLNPGATEASRIWRLSEVLGEDESGA